ncbi:type II secretion system F family protein [Micrococcales bacterium 31B]|nr:type II secretion system F family protein [Micrococcales bacterium 31B]
MSTTLAYAATLGCLLTAALMLASPHWWRAAGASRLHDRPLRPRGRFARFRRRRPPAPDLSTAMLMEILASALQAGLPLAHAVALLADLGQGEKSRSLHQLANALAMGAAWDHVWQRAPHTLQPLRKVLTLGQHSGAELSGLLIQAAADLRGSTQREATIESAKLAVHLMLPSGLLSLPAFVCLGIVPVVMSLFSKGWL